MENYQCTLEKLKRAALGDKTARDEIIEENLPLVHYVARRFRDRGAEYEDLYQYGCIGLVKAVDRFDPSYNVRFSTYAVPIIMGEIRRFLRDDGPVHVSRTIHDNAVRIEKCRQAFLRDAGREPTLEEISRDTGISAENVLLASNARSRVRSLSEPVGEGEIPLMDTLGETPMEQIDSRLALSQLLRELNDQECALIVRRYFHAHTQTAIARDMGVSQVQISRLESRIIKRLRAKAEG